LNFTLFYLKSFFLAKNQHRALIVSTKSDSDDEVVTITDESNPDFERFLAAPKLRKNSDD